MEHTSLVLFYNFSDDTYAWETGGIPIYIARVPTDVETAKLYGERIIQAAIETAGVEDTEMLYIIEDIQENTETIIELYKKFANEYNVYIEWEIEDLPLDLGEVVPEQGEINSASDRFLVVFYSHPFFSNSGNIDPEKEPPIAMYEVENAIDNKILLDMLKVLDNMKLNPVYWVVYPFTKERHEFFNSRCSSYITNVNSCLACLDKKEKVGDGFAACRRCELQFMRDYVRSLLEKGITEIYVDSDEVEIRIPEQFD